MPFITHTDHAIHGVGATAEAALADAKRTFENAMITFLDNDNDPREQPGLWIRAPDLRTTPCSVALAVRVQTHGGAIGWDLTAKGLAVIKEEVAI